MRTIVISMAFLLFFIFGCSDKVDPQVDTLYLTGGNRESQRLEAIPKLYYHYINSAKDKEVYEVIAEGDGRLIANFTPDLKLLTLCGDPGSGWGPQFKDVTASTLEEFVKGKISFDDLHSIGTIGSKFDSLLVRNVPFIQVKSNGEPSL
ncbi:MULTISPECIES: hypothetical protein [Dyadobacter]|uniref:Uncharacterized protein n=1 Tax=Dyadobacter chenhuakuii TaxID=2909339 RepID=A0A9X1QBT1_9BACT|nr:MULTISPECIES: hypothetical protein [Dyadobacter]MCF2498530.1 hypothetical protein [Dyadobacter chenhuakuii]MCF2516754.1 hypothetical protein [Dyadobacter sp. CY351]